MVRVLFWLPPPPPQERSRAHRSQGPAAVFVLETGLGGGRWLEGGCQGASSGELPSLGVQAQHPGTWVQAMLLLVCEGEAIFTLMCYFDIHKWV